MNRLLTRMLESQLKGNLLQKKHAIAFLIQETTLSGLYRGGFFNHAALRGACALSLFHLFDRHQETVEFSLTKEETSFQIAHYFPYIQNEYASLGLNLSIKEEPTIQNSPLREFTITGNTQDLFALCFSENAISQELSKDDEIRVGVILDTHPQEKATYETKYGLLPYPYRAKVFTLDCIFANNIEDILYKGWRHGHNGTNLYDFIFLLSKKAKANIVCLESNLIYSGHIRPGSLISLDSLKTMLLKRFQRTDFKEARIEALGYIDDPRAVDIWNEAFFISLLDALEAI